MDIREVDLQNNLLPCPFCGGKATYYMQAVGVTKTSSPHILIGNIECLECGASSVKQAYDHLYPEVESRQLPPLIEELRRRLEKLWNTRVESKDSEGGED